MRSQQYEDGRRAGVKACVQFVHDAADRMNSRSTKDALNRVAHELGVEMKRRALIAAKIEQEGINTADTPTT